MMAMHSSITVAWRHGQHQTPLSLRVTVAVEKWTRTTTWLRVDKQREIDRTEASDGQSIPAAAGAAAAENGDDVNANW